MESNSVYPLLNTVSKIIQGFETSDDKASKYNIFWAAGIEGAEVYISSFLRNLLDPKTKLHTMGYEFLRLFNETIKEEFSNDCTPFKLPDVLSNMNTLEVHKEYSIGSLSHDKGTGGRIDLLIKNGCNVIVIENKIFASDQPKQLWRYYEFIKRKQYNGTLLYLTLDGNTGKSCRSPRL